MTRVGSFDLLNPPAWVSPQGRKRIAELVAEIDVLRAKILSEKPAHPPVDASAGDQLKKLEALLDPRQPATPQGNPMPQVVAGLHALAAIDNAKALPGDKAFKTLQARVAMGGMQLLRTDARDGPVKIFAVNGSKALEMRSIEDIEGLLNYLRER